MIAQLRGRIAEKHPNRVIVDVGGVGYDVIVPLSTMYAIGEPGARVELRIHTHVREDALQLYGFATGLEQTLFEKLIAVSGIGLLAPGDTGQLNDGGPSAARTALAYAKGKDEMYVFQGGSYTPDQIQDLFRGLGSDTEILLDGGSLLVRHRATATAREKAARRDRGRATGSRARWSPPRSLRDRPCRSSQPGRDPSVHRVAAALRSSGRNRRSLVPPPVVAAVRRRF